jgi:hypothetical protein
MTPDHKPDDETGWYIFSADNGVVAGPIADRDAAERLAEGYGPGHVVLQKAEAEQQAETADSESHEE